jgi:hypothetical protein
MLNAICYHKECPNYADGAAAAGYLHSSPCVASKITMSQLVDACFKLSAQLSYCKESISATTPEHVTLNTDGKYVCIHT